MRLLEPLTTGFNFRRRISDTGELSEWSQPTMDQKTKLVCQPCNNGWMNDLEGAASAALSEIIRDGTPVSLTTSEVKSLADFAFKCAVVANHMNPDGDPFFTTFARQRFKESLQIPDGVQMWFGAFHGIWAYSGLFNIRYVKATSSAPNDLNFCVFTFAAGRLTFQVLAKRWVKILDFGKPFPAVHFDPVWDMAATQFWPIQNGPVNWPPSAYLDDDTIKRFTERLAGTVRMSLPNHFLVTNRT